MNDFLPPLQQGVIGSRHPTTVLCAARTALHVSDLKGRQITPALVGTLQMETDRLLDSWATDRQRRERTIPAFRFVRAGDELQIEMLGTRGPKDPR